MPLFALGLGGSAGGLEVVVRVLMVGSSCVIDILAVLEAGSLAELRRTACICGLLGVE